MTGGKKVCVCGDFNVVRSNEERRSMRQGSRPSDQVSFNQFIEVNDLVDLPWSGRRFTWYKGDGLSMSRIDRFLLSEEWCLEWPNCEQQAQLRGLSDHCPLSLSVDEVNWGPRPLRMLKCWQDVPGYKQFVNVPGRIDSLKDRLSVLDCKGEEEGLTVGEVLELHGITSDIHSLTRMNTSICWQQARLLWLREGDANSKPGVDDLQFHTLSFAEGGGLVKLFSIEEVRATVWDCDSYKSPGPDGIHFGFLKEFWGDMKDDVMRFLNEFHRNGKLTKGCGSVISEFQSAFVKERQILDGILIANEVVDDARKLHKELILFKVDFEKTYDSVDWGYLETVMRQMAFPTLWRKWIRECVSTATASVLVNGSPTDEFPLERGLRQGDPLSPFMFLLAAEGLNVMMQAMIQSSLFTGYSIGTKLPTLVSHHQFADDTLLLGAKSWANVCALRAVLVLFEAVSGLKVNFHKSMLVGVNIIESWLAEAACVLGCRVGVVPFMYLGLPIGGEPRLLLKSVLTSLPVYALSFFKAPSGIISSIESLLTNFFWGGCEDKRKIPWISWNIVCLRKEDGGLGVRQLREFNVALLGKWCWRALVDKTGLWYRVLAARYGEHAGRVREGGRNRSTWWKEIVRLRDAEGDEEEMGWFAAGVERRVGNGVDTLFWTDPWLGGVPLSVRFRRMFDLSQHKLRTVAEMRELRWGEGGAALLWRSQLWVWEEELVAECRGLLSNTILQTHEADKWVWRHDPGGGYTVRGAYNLLTRTDMGVDEVPTDLIWHKQVPSKVSVLAWRLLRNRLPTKDNLVRRHIITPDAHFCVTGCGEVETAQHLFLSCPIFAPMWSSLRAWVGISCNFFGYAVFGWCAKSRIIDFSRQRKVQFTRC
ncbi:hypothetical protein TSUD_98280 [Trifolium subterraneum]|uniref:Reverse transcriptase domain-containing protein n=1 Tax=Trifolium subterraneum TaxID=3900 RepID=A0A2Z6MVJ6_TRISU|nr:hypothetical protein TSUD_98280 [Trifolium subterraneum]